MLPSVRTMHELGFKLYASPGTADFYTEHGITVSCNLKHRFSLPIAKLVVEATGIHGDDQFVI